MRSLIGFSVVLVVLFSSAGCVPPEPEEDLTRAFPDTTVMGLVQQAGVLRVGLPDDLMAGDAQDDPDNAWVGFLRPMGEAVAAKLGVEAEFSSAPSEELLELVEADEIDLAFPMLAITEKLVRKNAVGDPYFVSHQRLGVAGDGEVSTVDDLLASHVVCPVKQRGMRVPLETLNDTVEPLEPQTLERCYRALDRGTADVVTGPGPDLVVLASSLPELTVTGEELATFGYGPVTERGSSGWVGFVENVLSDYRGEGGGWSEAYDDHLAGILGDAEPPDLTVEEAAALYPRDL